MNEKRLREIEDSFTDKSNVNENLHTIDCRVAQMVREIRRQRKQIKKLKQEIKDIVEFSREVATGRA